jgi:hypothetical protein
MRLLKLIKVFSKYRQHHHQYRDHGGRFHCREHLKPNENEGTVSLNNMLSRQVCPGCKNHCDLASPKCKRGKEYAILHGETS